MPGEGGGVGGKGGEGVGEGRIPRSAVYSAYLNFKLHVCVCVCGAARPDS